MSLTEFFSYGVVSTLSRSCSEEIRGILIIISSMVCIAVPYLLGSLNFAIIISKTRYGADIRTFGSGNAGATNMMRTFGKSAAGLTFLGDALKAFVSGLVGYALLGQYGAYIAGLFCILGHMFPIYYKFKGGKGVVTAAISILMCNPIVFVILFVLFVIIVACTKYISLGSVMCMLLYPVILDRIEKWFNGATGAYVIIAMLIAALVIFMHRENIKRLWQGKENKFSFKKSVKPTVPQEENTNKEKSN